MSHAANSGPTPALRKKVFLAVISGLVTLCLAVGMCELVLRAKFSEIRRITGAAEWTPGPEEDKAFKGDRYHPRYGWTLVPGYRSGPEFPFRFSINAQGLRGERDYAPRPQAETPRIAIFGDSCIFGEEVNDDETVPHHLERALRDAEALNFGVHGYGLGQMALRLQDEGFSFHPDHAVLVILIPADLARDTTAHYMFNKPVFSIDGSGALHVGNLPVPVATRQPWILRHSFAAAWLFGRPDVTLSEEDKTLGDAVSVGRAILARVNTQCAERGVSLTVVLIVVPDTLRDMAEDPASARMIRYIQRSLIVPGVDRLDLTGYLAELYGRDGVALEAEYGHWTGQGNALIAEQIAEHLARKDAALTMARP